MKARLGLSSDFVIAYHGTDADVAADVLARRDHLEPSRRGFDWLGDGIYFWEDDPHRALWWARRSREESLKSNGEWSQPVKVDRPAVLGAVIYIGNCLDLTNARSMDAVIAAHHALTLKYKSNKWRLPANSYYYRTLDCLVINETCRAMQRLNGVRVDTVRGVFVDGEDKSLDMAYRNSYLFAQSYKALSVRSRKMIVDYFAVAVSED